MLLILPKELIVSIVEYITEYEDMLAFMLACKYTKSLVNKDVLRDALLDKKYIDIFGYIMYCGGCDAKLREGGIYYEHAHGERYSGEECYCSVKCAFIHDSSVQYFDENDPCICVFDECNDEFEYYAYICIACDKHRLNWHLCTRLFK